MMNHRNSERAEITHREVTAVVKWFNSTKGFGFVQLSDGSPDAFLHVSVVEQSGNRDLIEGTTIVCDLCAGRKGPQVAEIHRVESVPEAPVSEDFGASETTEGTVKFFNAEKGFGFVTPDDGGKDVFVSARILEKSGIGSLASDQRVRLQVRMGQKGPMADQVDLI
ncbi:MAG: cold-shock protein [Pseudomonadota bacterium]